MAASAAAMIHSAGPKPAHARSPAPTKKPAPFTAFLLPVSQATQRKSPASGARSFTADLDDVFARSFATPEAPCTAITKATETPTAQPGSRRVSATSAST